MSIYLYLLGKKWQMVENYINIWESCTIDFQSFIPRFVSTCVTYFDSFWAGALSLKHYIDHSGWTSPPSLSLLFSFLISSGCWIKGKKGKIGLQERWAKKDMLRKLLYDLYHLLFHFLLLCNVRFSHMEKWEEGSHLWLQQWIII